MPFDSQCLNDDDDGDDDALKPSNLHVKSRNRAARIMHDSTFCKSIPLSAHTHPSL